MQCQFALYFLSNSFLIKAAMSCVHACVCVYTITQDQRMTTRSKHHEQQEAEINSRCLPTVVCETHTDGTRQRHVDKTSLEGSAPPNTTHEIIFQERRSTTMHQLQHNDQQTRCNAIISRVYLRTHLCSHSTDRAEPGNDAFVCTFRYHAQTTLKKFRGIYKVRLHGMD